MKKSLLLFLLALLLVSCGDDKGTNPPPDDQDTTWNPAAELSLANYSTSIRYLLTDGNYLYVCGSGGFLGIIDVSDSDTLKLIGYHASTGQTARYPRGMAKYNNYILCSFGTDSSVPDSVEVFDVSNPSSPTPIAAIESWMVPAPGSGYRQFGKPKVIGDTLAILEFPSASAQLYRINNPGSPVYLDWLYAADIASCGSAGMSGLWTDAQYWYVFGVCTDTDHHPKLWVLNRGSMNLVKENSLPDNVYNTWSDLYRGAHAYCWNKLDNAIYDVDATNPQSAVVSNTLQVPNDFSFPDGFGFTVEGVFTSGTGFVLTGKSTNGVNQYGFVALDGNLHYTGHSIYGTGYWDATGNNEMVYLATTQNIVAYDRSN